MNIPTFKRIDTAEGIDTFAIHYQQCSGFNVNRNYFKSNQVFAIYFMNQMIGGFVLGSGATLRTMEVFAGSEHRAGLYQQIQQFGTSTEMCCFWITPKYRKNTWLNFFVWACVAYSLRVYGSRHLVFGTNSTRLAALYQHASKSTLLHTDYLNHRQTYIFHGPRKYCLLGVVEILYYKTKRLAKIATNRQRTTAQVAM